MESLAPPDGLDDWMKAKAAYAARAKQVFFATWEIAERTIQAFPVLVQALPPLNPADHRTRVVPLMVMAAHRRLLNALQLLLEGQVGEAHAVARPVLEMAGHAYQIVKRPELADVWLNKDADPDAYDKGFRLHFPKGIPEMQRLFRRWCLMSDSGSHANLKEFAFHYDREPKAMIIRYFPDLENDLPMQEKMLIYFVSHCMEVLDLYSVLLSEIVGTDVRGKVSHQLQIAQDHVNICVQKMKERGEINEAEIPEDIKAMRRTG